MTKKILNIIFLSVISLLISVVVLSLFLYKSKTKIKISEKELEYSQISNYDKKIYSFLTQNKNASQGQIVFIGDSITDYYHPDDYYADLPLATYNRGIAGDTTKWLFGRIKLSLYDIAPSKVVLMIGINDINSKKDNQYIIEMYEKILDGIKQNLPTTEVYCMSVLSLNSKRLNYVKDIDINAEIDQIKDFNVLLENLVSKKDYTYVDLFSQTIDENGFLMSEYSDDGIHLNSNGYEVWTNIVKPYLQDD